MMRMRSTEGRSEANDLASEATNVPSRSERPHIRITSPGAPETVCGWTEFAAANDPDTVDDVAAQIAELGVATLGGGAAPLVIIEPMEVLHAG